MLGFLVSISNSDSDSLPGCLIHLLPPYSCNSTGGRVTPQEALVRTCCTIQEPWQKGRFSIPATRCHCGTSPEGKLCVHPLLRHRVAGKGLPYLQTPNLQIRCQVTLLENKQHPSLSAWTKQHSSRKKSQVTWQSLRLTVFAQGYFWALWRDLLTSLPC